MEVSCLGALLAGDHAGHGPAGGGHQVPRRVRGAPEEAHGGDQAERRHHPGVRLLHVHLPALSRSSRALLWLLVARSSCPKNKLPLKGSCLVSWRGYGLSSKALGSIYCPAELHAVVSLFDTRKESSCVLCQHGCTRPKDETTCMKAHACMLGRWDTWTSKHSMVQHSY
jgi:hypothetical protein